MEKTSYKRLESLDVLRGFDLFCLILCEATFYLLRDAINAPWFNKVMWNFSHVFLGRVFSLGFNYAVVYVYGGSFYSFCFIPL